MVELIIALSLSALIAIYATAQLAKQSEETLAEGSAAYISQVAAATERHVLLNFNEYANATNVLGVAVDTQPTVAELVALGRLNAGFPSGAGSLPTRQTVRIDVTKANCPGANCTLTTLVCTTTPVNLGGANVRFDLASTMVDRQNGSGGQSLQGNGATIRGPVLNVPNPLGNIEGIVCGSSVVDTALYQRFLTMNETRDPNFQGPVTINNSLNVTGPGATASVGTCAKILAATGRAGFGCANPDDLPAGYTGGVRAPDLVANSRILASDNPAGFTGSNGNYAYAGIQGGVAEIRTSGRSAGDRLTPLGQYSAGASCTAADEGSIARRAGATGLVVCQTGTWRPLATAATSGDVCTPEGTMATSSSGVALLCVNGAFRGMDTIIRPGTPGAACTDAGVTAIDTSNQNEVLICRKNSAGGTLRYMRLRDVTQHLVFVRSDEVNDGTVSTKPTCSPAAGQTALPIIQLIPKTISTSDGGIAVYATETTTTWKTYLRNGSGTTLGSDATAIAQIFCYFP